ncbi:GNAT family N-acetyltransferase [Luteolibacter sp. Populi]|uniref:GNAT family N-acetyltransferase n=1 Tax=Luteolibacter sp. Populi TaxID=3230487 RepID=UPI0034670315
MSGYDLELLSGDHDRQAFSCGRDSLDRYLKETARGHLTKGVSVTRVLLERDAVVPKRILGYFTLTTTLAEAKDWPGVAKGLPQMPVPVVLLGRLATAAEFQGRGIARLLIAAAREIAAASLQGTGGIGLAVDAAEEEVVALYEKYGFRRVAGNSLRLFLPTASLP